MVNKRPTKSAKGPRIRKATWRQRRRQLKKDIGKRAPLIGSIRLTKQTFGYFKKFWLPLGAILIVYISLSMAFASGLGDISHTYKQIKGQVQEAGDGRQFGSALDGYGSLYGSIGSGNSEAGVVLEGVLFIIISLAIIWTLRQLLADKSFGIKAIFYYSTGQLTPFLLVMAIIILELLPLALGVAIMDAVFATDFETWGVIIFGFISIVLALATIYMIAGSIFALYIVTLPKMTPIAAVRSANNLVRFRRLLILRRLVYLPIFVALSLGLIMIPLILYAHILVAPVFFGLVLASILFAHTYLYGLYRSLLA